MLGRFHRLQRDEFDMDDGTYTVSGPDSYSLDDFRRRGCSRYGIGEFTLIDHAYGRSGVDPVERTRWIRGWVGLILPRRAHLIQVNDVGESNGFIAVRAASTRADLAGKCVAVLAALGPEVPVPAGVALVDGAGLGHDHQRRQGSCVQAPPGGLPAGGVAVALASLGDEGAPAEGAGDRRAVVADGVHAATFEVARRVAGDSGVLMPGVPQAPVRLPFNIPDVYQDAEVAAML